MCRIKFSVKTMLVVVFLMVVVTTGYAQPMYITDNLSSNRYDSLSSDTLQIVIFYDGKRSVNTAVRIKCINDTTGATAYIYINDLPKFDSQLKTAEYYCNGYYPNGEIYVSGVIADGVIDGVAVGLYWKTSSGKYKIARSNQLLTDTGPIRSQFIGAWPYGYSSTYLYDRMPQVSDSFARCQAVAALYGAMVFPNGYHYAH